MYTLEHSINIKILLVINVGQYTISERFRIVKVRAELNVLMHIQRSDPTFNPYGYEMYTK